MYLIITSHKNNAVALDHLFDSLEQCDGIDDIDVIAVVGGYGGDTYEDGGKRGNFRILRAPHNSIDFTGLLAIVDTQLGSRDSRYFYIHDTTRAGPRFVHCLKALPATLQTASFAFPSMNMGLYSRTVLEEQRHLLETFRNTDDSCAQKFKARCVDMEDCIFRGNLDNHSFISEGPPLLQGPPRAYYDTGALRQVEYYPAMDLYKIKANWYVKPTYQLSL